MPTNSLGTLHMAGYQVIIKITISEVFSSGFRHGSITGADKLKTTFHIDIHTIPHQVKVDLNISFSWHFLVSNNYQKYFEGSKMHCRYKEQQA